MHTLAAIRISSRLIPRKGAASIVATFQAWKFASSLPECELREDSHRFLARSKEKVSEDQTWLSSIAFEIELLVVVLTDVLLLDMLPMDLASVNVKIPSGFLLLVVHLLAVPAMD
jgi:hypothetical protein